jgi:hypothetical protein
MTATPERVAVITDVRDARPTEGRDSNPRWTERPTRFSSPPRFRPRARTARTRRADHRGARAKRPMHPAVGLFTRQTPAKCGKIWTPQTLLDRRKSLQIATPQKQLYTTENRGVLGSSPGLAIGMAL